MLILEKGTVLSFVCDGCDCEFIAGIHSVETPDGGENYYCKCPMCGIECHTDRVYKDIVRSAKKE